MKAQQPLVSMLPVSSRDGRRDISTDAIGAN